MEGHFPNNVKVLIGWLIIVKTCVYLQYLAMRNMWISVPFLFMLWRPRLLLQAHPLEVVVPAPGRKSFCAKSFALTALVKRKQTAEVDWYMYHWVNHEILTRHTVLMTPQYIHVMCCASQGSHIDWFGRPNWAKARRDERPVVRTQAVCGMLSQTFEIWWA